MNERKKREKQNVPRVVFFFPSSSLSLFVAVDCFLTLLSFHCIQQQTVVVGQKGKDCSAPRRNYRHPQELMTTWDPSITTLAEAFE
jgi:hypothetical protein